MDNLYTITLDDLFNNRSFRTYVLNTTREIIQSANDNNVTVVSEIVIPCLHPYHSKEEKRNNFILNHFGATYQFDEEKCRKGGVPLVHPNYKNMVFIIYDDFYGRMSYSSSNYKRYYCRKNRKENDTSKEVTFSYYLSKKLMISVKR